MNALEDQLKRCDRCPAPARYQVMVTPELDVLLCLHHYKQHGKALDKAHYPMLPVA